MRGASTAADVRRRVRLPTFRYRSAAVPRCSLRNCHRAPLFYLGFIPPLQPPFSASHRSCFSGSLPRSSPRLHLAVLIVSAPKAILSRPLRHTAFSWLQTATPILQRSVLRYSRRMCRYRSCLYILSLCETSILFLFMRYLPSLYVRLLDLPETSTFPLGEDPRRQLHVGSFGPVATPCSAGTVVLRRRRRAPRSPPSRRQPPCSGVSTVPSFRSRRLQCLSATGTVNAVSLFLAYCRSNLIGTHCHLFPASSPLCSLGLPSRALSCSLAPPLTSLSGVPRRSALSAFRAAPYRVRGASCHPFSASLLLQSSRLHTAVHLYAIPFRSFDLPFSIPWLHASSLSLCGLTHPSARP